MSVQWNERYARRTGRMGSSAIRELLKLTQQPEFISFAGGLPAPEIFPAEEAALVSGRILREAGSVALQYGPTEGYMPLREYVAESLRAEGVPVTADNVLITTGSQQGLDLVGKVLLDPGDRVVVESPTYLAALQAWKAYEAEFIPVTVDEEGLDVEAVDALGGEPALMYVLPNFQNPRGVTLSRVRRERLVADARRNGVPILEDDPYHDLRFAGEHLPRLITLDAALDEGEQYTGNVISLGTVSKILAPGLRVGWAVADASLIRTLVHAKQGTDLHTSMLDQMIAYDMLSSGYIRDHTHTIIDTYRARRDLMLAALAEHFPEGVRWTNPQGGMFLWVTLPEGIDSMDLLRAAVDERVAFVPGPGFHTDGGGANTLRLSFSNASPDKIWEGIRRLRRAYDRVMEGVGEPITTVGG